MSVQWVEVYLKRRRTMKQLQWIYPRSIKCHVFSGKANCHWPGNTIFDDSTWKRGWWPWLLESPRRGISSGTFSQSTIQQNLYILMEYHTTESVHSHGVPYNRICTFSWSTIQQNLYILTEYHTTESVHSHGVPYNRICTFSRSTIQQNLYILTEYHTFYRICTFSRSTIQQNLYIL